ncbi:PAS fold-4 domain protein (plasmid) [Gemmatirosa kalamazoonensis]|uniref:PAS fold-4 domain protein n=1 Tax=Gemmatirosa kalamazoonensis TaxID=861299 RepID=W0RR37_9BACT|nr:HEAT repeat domain-containing protein [Gemmatirosa kalamazoonensis]AHG93449.1 PAS fold-4 domain protein [Gemmatirosa kalamazoonensis]
MSVATGSVGVFTTDLALVVRSWDAWLAAATGVDESEAYGRPLAELFPDLDARGHLARLRRVADSGVVQVLAPAFHEYLLACPPRTASARFARMQQHVTIAPLRDGETIVGVTVTVEDVTARRDRERELAEELRSPDDLVRLRAVRALDTEAAAPEPLAGALGDSSWRVRRAAAEGLARVPDDGVVDLLLSALRERHRDPGVLNAALTALARAHHDVVPPLVQLLDAAGSDAELRTYVILALGLLQDVRAVPVLIRALADVDANVRFHAIEALGRIRSRAAALPVAEVAESRDFSVAFAALDTLAAIGEPSVAPRLLPLLDDELLQPAVVDALARLGGEDAVAPLTALLDQPGSPTLAVAVALATLHARLDATGASTGGIAEFVRAVAPAGASRSLLGALPTAGEAERAAAVTVLGWLSVEGMETTLAALLAHPDACRAVVDVLVQRGAAAVDPLLDALTQDDDGVRKAAAAALGRIGSAAAVPALVALLDDAPEVAVVAAGALGSIGDRRAFEPLIARLDDPHAAVRQAAVGALHSLGHPESSARVVVLLADPSPRVREAAARMAGYFAFAACVEPLLSLRHDDDEAVRRAAVEQLVQFDDPRAREALGEALADDTPSTRAAAARALSHVAPADAVPGLLAALRDPDPWVRYYAARSAGRLRTDQALPELLRLAVGDDAPPVRIAAVDALGEIGSEDELRKLVPLAADPEPLVARAALLALGGSSDPATLAPLVAALDGDDRATAVAALDALVRRADPRAASAVASFARASDVPDVWTRALHALERMGGVDAIAALVGIAADPVRTAAAVEALAGVGERDAAWVARGLDDADVHVRCAVVEALGRSPHAAAAPLLAAALHDESPAVRTAAAHALAQRDLRSARTTDARSVSG